MRAHSPAGTQPPCRSRPFAQVQGSVELPGEPGDLLAAATAIARRYVGPTKRRSSADATRCPGELLVRMWVGEDPRALQHARLRRLD